jgi:hypothetical protein
VEEKGNEKRQDSHVDRPHDREGHP